MFDFELFHYNRVVDWVLNPPGGALVVCGVVGAWINKSAKGSVVGVVIVLDVLNIKTNH
jgi:hypothetical protein